MSYLTAIEAGAVDVSSSPVAGITMLRPNDPNPFRGSTIIPFSLPFAGDVTLEVFDPAGRLVRTLLRNDRRGPGHHEVAFRAEHLPSGVYLVRLKIGPRIESRRIVLL